MLSLFESGMQIVDLLYKMADSFCYCTKFHSNFPQ